MDRAMLLHVKSTILHCPPSIIIRQRASVDSKLLRRPRNVSYYNLLNNNAQTPLNQFVAGILATTDLCTKSEISTLTNYKDIQEALLWQRDCATRLSVEILQLQNILFEN